MSLWVETEEKRKIREEREFLASLPRNARRRLLNGTKKLIQKHNRAAEMERLVENRYEKYHRRGKDYADATHERENARRVRQREAHTHVA